MYIFQTLKVFQFDPQRQIMSVIVQNTIDNNSLHLYVKGSPEQIADMSLK